MLNIHFAPLQGYTESAYRQAHFLYVGGITAYYTPFFRIEKGEAREKDLRDLQRDLEFIKCKQSNVCHCENQAYNTSIDSSCHSPGLSSLDGDDGESRGFYNVIPQVICKDVHEFRILVDAIQKLKQDCGFATDEVFPQIDINMGCPFPMQAKSGRGSGILPRVDSVKEILQEISKRATPRHSERSEESIKFSVKMRLGYTSPEECLALLPLLNEAPLAHITMHPRLGIQLYKGALDIASFQKFYEGCKHPVIFNGDISSIKDIQAIADRFPNLKGIMIGRGLLANPALATQYQAGSKNTGNPIPALIKIHSSLQADYRKRLQGDSQILDKIRPFWTYATEAAQTNPEMANYLPKRTIKKIAKARNLSEYLDAVKEISL